MAAVLASSGRPATLVSRLRIPARTLALATISQFTSPSATAVPMVATAVCATVLMARTPAALIQFFQFLIM